MMAFDRTPPRAALDPETVEALRKALGASVSRGNHVDDLREILCKAAADARSKGIQAEQLLVTLKEIWYGLPQIAGTKSGGLETILLQELISRCIQEYYSL